MDDGKKKKEDKPAHPRETANVFSALTFAWTLGLFREGNKRDLEVEDLYVPLKEHTSNVLGDRIEKKWREECKRAAIKKREPSLLRVLLRIFGPKLMAYGLVLAIVENVCRVSQPLFLGKMIEYFTQDGGGTVSKDEAYFYAGGVVMCSALSVFIMHPYMFSMMHIGMKMRVASCSLIYRKALRLNKTALGQTTVGQVVNLLSNDVSRFDMCTIFLHYLWVGPLETIVMLYFLWDFAGPASVFGVFVLLALIPLQVWLGKMTSGLRMRTALRTDGRVRLMNEIISGIQVIKMYTWEKPFAYLVSQARKREIKEIRGASYIRGLLLSFVIFHSRVAIFMCIFVYILMGNAINAEKVFVVASYFNGLRQTMTVFFPQGIGYVAEVLISIKRLRTFLNYNETTLQQAPEIMKANKTKSVKDEEVEPIFRAPREDARTKVAADEGITVTNAMARWTPEVADDSLSHINLRVVPGKLTAIIGPVGSGKTSLLHALLGELPLKTGSVSIPENVSTSLLHALLGELPLKTGSVSIPENTSLLHALLGELPLKAGSVSIPENTSLLHALLGELPLKTGSVSIPENVSYASQESWLFAGSVRQNILFGSPYDRERYRQVVRVCALKADFEQFPYGDKTIVGERGVSLSGGQRARINLARAVYKDADVYLLDDPLSAVDTHVGKHLFEDCVTGYLRKKTVILITHQIQYLGLVDHVVVMNNGSIDSEGTYQELQGRNLEFLRLSNSEEEANEEGNQNRNLYKRHASIQSVRSVASSMEDGKIQAEPSEIAEMRSKGTVSGRVYKTYMNLGVRSVASSMEDGKIQAEPPEIAEMRSKGTSVRSVASSMEDGKIQDEPPETAEMRPKGTSVRSVASSMEDGKIQDEPPETAEMRPKGTSVRSVVSSMEDGKIQDEPPEIAEMRPKGTSVRSVASSMEDGKIQDEPPEIAEMRSKGTSVRSVASSMEDGKIQDEPPEIAEMRSKGTSVRSVASSMEDGKIQDEPPETAEMRPKGTSVRSVASSMEDGKIQDEPPEIAEMRSKGTSVRSVASSMEDGKIQDEPPEIAEMRSKGTSVRSVASSMEDGKIQDEPPEIAEMRSKGTSVRSVASSMEDGKIQDEPPEIAEMRSKGTSVRSVASSMEDGKIQDEPPEIAEMRSKGTSVRSVASSMEDGKIQDEPPEIAEMRSKGTSVRSVASSMEDGKIQDEPPEIAEMRSKGTSVRSVASSMEDGKIQDEPPEIAEMRSKGTSVRSVASSMEDGKIQDEPPEIAEMRSKGTVSGRVYKTYMKSGGNCCMLMFFLATAVLTQLLASGGDYWITYWVNLEEYGYVKSESASSIAQPLQQSLAQPLLQVANASFTTTTMLPSTATNTTETTLLSLPLTRDMCVYVFSAITAATVIVTLFRSYLFFYLCMRASRRLHDTMFNSITRATMHFFNTNSSGRILNRFSKDMGSIDEQLPAALIDSLQIGLSLIGIIVVVGLVNYWLMVPTVFIGILFYFLRNFYLSTSRSVKRLEGVTRSPVFSHLNASLQGLTTIRAFHAQQILEKEFDNHQDLHSSAWYIFIASSRAFGFWLDGVCLIYIALVTFSFLFMGSETFGGNVGLAITQSIGLTGMFQWGMRQSAELENQMTSVERVMEYTDIEKEPPLESPPDKQPPATWPDEGRVTFNRVFLSYGPNEPPVLKNLNFTIAPKEKVGIVGRTGAGKSSLIAALFRLAEVQGEIDIDYIVTSSIGLHELRSKISIIPQEPVLFSGTVRKNLDPFDQYTDSVLWNALEEVELKEVIKDLAGGLNGKMSEGGSNLSVGQRQLVCLARAIVRNNRILVMDEATANVDPQTDGLIQSTIRRKFAECTVLTIAHRLNTVMDSDKVLVMSAGTAVEFNHPHILLQNQEGVLYGMVEQTGKVTRDLLHNIAAASYRRKHKEEVTSSTESKKTS
ncbi:probable multidrug resistance-associated protein lethal(2)03659 [Macrosteles quadrilineatus]|uniref:probable multidrug resistance-associated protein lethal(2)03659 n=1 Tax=Macrosteles quadrilineatus TaxID=74068 RepID=UPI0023E15949|nr:probable multidrug resistance-associated protein lethal(2)03659 [Macrosteles quadrilineatus]